MKYHSEALSYFKTLSKVQEYLSPEDERALLIQSKSEDQKLSQRARDRLIKAHIRLAFKHAVRFIGRIEGNVITVDDLIQEATAALCYALDKFDVDVPVRFATYGKFWINAYLSDHLHANGYQLKYSMSNDSKVVARMYRRLWVKYGKLGLSDKEVNVLIAKDLRVSPYVVAAMAPSIMTMNAPFELDRSFTVDDNDEMSNDLEDDAPRPDQLAEYNSRQELLRKRIKKAVNKLKPRERDIIRKRHMAENPMTLDTLGIRYAVSKERIRQLESKALKLLHKELKDVVDA